MLIPFSLMMYAIPYPSAVTGPKPRNRNAGFPLFEVHKMEVFSRFQPGSAKIAGRLF